MPARAVVLRGRAMDAAGRLELSGTPVDRSRPVETLTSAGGVIQAT